jgi:hypothetical protein
MILTVLVLLAVVVVVWIFSAPLAQWLRSAQAFAVVAFLKEHRLAAAIIGGCLLIPALIWTLIWLPKWQVARPDLTTKERFKLENDARKTLAEIVGGAALLVGLYFTWSSLEVSREEQVTERFTKAIDQLGAVDEKGVKKLEIRLGGIYALERIARDSERDHWPIMEILTAYVREHAPLRQDEQFLGELGFQNPPTDIKAILTVLRRRERMFGKGEDQPLDLANTDLRAADLRDIHLEGAILWSARLEWADLRGIHLKGADLRGTRLKAAILGGAYLQGALYLTVEQLCAVGTLYEARLDPPLTEQIREQCPQLLEKPPG